ncbi:hypothetical protein [Erwinia oleae]|uniref:hypothetical protein n=1 Tax=Erwinia oleae TaxID=796334 RepID=UPI000A5427D1|nr:hypothetical protein [Erwinia oleae]
MINVILQLLSSVKSQRFVLDSALFDGLLLRVIPAIVGDCSVLLKFEARNV